MDYFIIFVFLEFQIKLLAIFLSNSVLVIEIIMKIIFPKIIHHATLIKKRYQTQIKKSKFLEIFIMRTSTNHGKKY
jgi:hypothetical protein